MWAPSYDLCFAHHYLRLWMEWFPPWFYYICATSNESYSVLNFSLRKYLLCIFLFIPNIKSTNNLLKSILQTTTFSGISLKMLGLIWLREESRRWEVFWTANPYSTCPVTLFVLMPLWLSPVDFSLPSLISPNPLSMYSCLARRQCELAITMTRFWPETLFKPSPWLWISYLTSSNCLICEVEIWFLKLRAAVMANEILVPRETTTGESAVPLALR